MKTADKYRETIVNLEYDLTETPVIISSMGPKPIGWDIEAKDIHSNSVIIESSVSRDMALQRVFEKVIIKEGYENLDKPSRGEILCIFRAAQVLLENYGHATMPVEIARDTAKIMRETLDKIDAKPARKSAKKRKSKSRKS